MTTRVLDSHALLAFLQGERAADEVKKILLDAEVGRYILLLCVVNWGEVYYSILRRTSPETADNIAREITAMPIELVPVETDLRLVRQAALYKANWKLPYADAFAAALAKLRNAELITGDRDFKAVEREIKIGWLK